MRPRLTALVLALAAAAALAAPARADVMPEPGRPEWEHTPMPAPEEPASVLLLAALAAGAVAIVAGRRGTSP